MGDESPTIRATRQRVHKMSTTQQHWLTHSDGLFLVYTRKEPSNVKFIEEKRAALKSG
jgi:uncharacterized phage-like protein YoqJ